MGRSVWRSSVAEPPGPDRVMVARLSCQSGCMGSAKAKLEAPSPWATSGMSKARVNNSAPVSDRALRR